MLSSVKPLTSGFFGAKPMVGIKRKMSKELRFNPKRNRGTINLQVLIVEISTLKNWDKFISNFCKLLIVNKYLDKKPLNFVNFSSSYDKSWRVHRSVTGQLFELIDTRNEKPITGGALGFDDRLEIFLSDPLKHLPVFDRCLKSNGVDLSELCSRLPVKASTSMIMWRSSRWIQR